MMGFGQLNEYQLQFLTLFVQRSVRFRSVANKWRLCEMDKFVGLLADELLPRLTMADPISSFSGLRGAGSFLPDPA